MYHANFYDILNIDRKICNGSLSKINIYWNYHLILNISVLLDLTKDICMNILSLITIL